MEFGDIIYFVLLLFFMILGFFNNSQKKKDQQKKELGGDLKPFAEKIDETFYQKMERQRKTIMEKPTPPPPVPAAYTAKDVHRKFQSSMDLVTDFEGQSSLKSSIFVYDADSSFAQETDSTDVFNKNVSSVQKSSTVHPLVKDLLGDGGREELKKGLIYGEIIQRKY